MSKYDQARDPGWPRQSLVSCARKRRYVTLDYATYVRNLMAERNPGDHFNVYSCGFCGGYHVGRSEKE